MQLWQITDLAKNVQAASASLSEMNKSYGTAMKAVGAMADVKRYRRIPRPGSKVTKNLAALNSIYEMELKDADSHVKNMNKFYESLTGAMQGLSTVGINTSKFTSELEQLTDNLIFPERGFYEHVGHMRGTSAK